MFEGLKKKFSSIISGFVKKEESEAEKEIVQEPQQQAVPQEPVKIEEKKEEKRPEPKKEEPKLEPKKEEQKEHKKEVKLDERAISRPIEKPTRVVESKSTYKEDHKVKEVVAPKIEEPISTHAPQRQVQKAEVKEKKADAIKLSVFTKIKKAMLGSVVLSDAEVDRFLSGLRISMLESDVAFDVVEIFVDDLGNMLKGKKIASASINDEVIGSVRQALLDTLNKGASGFSFMDKVRAPHEGPFVILFLGPNGTGKTTTIAKIATRLKKEGISTVISASDTFRAAAIEQMEFHANKVGVPIIKSSYGADPASIAFDAVAYARAHRIDTVLIDSAGRQETNPSLIREMEKMVRVAKPTMIVFVGESTAGNAIASQIVEFNNHMKIDGIVLTKLDCDAKGGGALSISHLTGIPIIFLGVGEGYDALVDYTPEFIADAIVPGAN